MKKEILTTDENFTKFVKDIKTKILDINVVRAPETPFIIIIAIIPISNIFSILAVLIKNKFCIFFT